MKTVVALGLLVALSYARAGIVPASTTFLRQATTITHPSISYTQPISYSSPLAYSFVPSAYSQPLLSNAYYANPLFSSSPLVAHQPIYQYPGLVAQSPAVQYPFGPQGVSQVGVPHVEGEEPQAPVQPPQSPPQAPPAQSPILSGPPAGTTSDDDTVSVEAA